MTQTSTKTLLLNLQWLYSIGAKVMRVAPVQTIAITVLTVLSQITLLLAFLLPIKVLILLGSDKVPRYFPEFLTLLDREMLIVALTATSISCYLIHLVLDRWNERLGAAGTHKILARTRKFELFENQTGRARRAYVQYSSGLAALVFLCTVLLALGVVYPLVALVIAAVFFMAFIIGLSRFHWERTFRNEVFQQLPEYWKMVADLTFLSVFLFIVADYLRGDPPSLLIGLITLILVRQWTGRSTTLIAHSTSLVSRRIEVSTLFFHTQTAIHAPDKTQPALWQVVEKQRLGAHFDDALRSAGIHDATVQDSRWLQTGIPGIACFLLYLDQTDSSNPRQLLVRLFAKQRRTYANNEFTILTMHNAESLPAPRLIGVSTLEGLTCHVFEVSEVNHIPVPDRLQAIASYRIILSAINLTPEFLNKYHRSHPGIWLRIDRNMIDRFTMIANNNEQVEAIEHFRAELPDVQEFLKGMPASLVHAEATRQNIFTDSTDMPICIHWGRWSVEPLGCSWPVKDTEIELLDECYANLIELNPSLSSVPKAHIKFAALAWELERLYQRELFEDCLTLLKTIMSQFQDLQCDNLQTMVQSR